MAVISYPQQMVVVRVIVSLRNFHDFIFCQRLQPMADCRKYFRTAFYGRHHDIEDGNGFAIAGLRAAGMVRRWQTAQTTRAGPDDRAQQKEGAAKAALSAL